MSTRTRFEKEAKGNSEMAYSPSQVSFIPNPHIVTKGEYKIPQQAKMRRNKTVDITGSATRTRITVSGIKIKPNTKQIALHVSDFCVLLKHE